MSGAKAAASSCSSRSTKRLPTAIASTPCWSGRASTRTGHRRDDRSLGRRSGRDASRSGLADAGLEPSAVQYAEAHGTGTPVGDPIEAAALGAVFGSNGERFLIGSVKTNIGHLEAAAGAAGLIKSALALHHRQIPPSLNFEEPSPDIDFDALALRVVTELEPWPSNGAARTATVNSFGFGGANANAVLQEAPRGEAAGDTTPAQIGPHLLPVSARSPEARDELAKLYSERLQGADEDAYLSICRAARAVALITTSARGCRANRRGGLRGPRCCRRRPAVAVGGNRSAEVSGASLARVRLLGMGPQWWAMGATGSRGARLRQGARALRRDLRAPRGLVAARGGPAGRG